jgi:hypothetical protein
MVVSLASKVHQLPFEDLYTLKTLFAVKSTGDVLDDSFYRQKFESVFAKYGQITMKVSSWRHYTKFVFREYLGDTSLETMEETLEEETAQQFGHSEATSKHYGTSNIYGVAGTNLSISLAWHGFLCLSLSSSVPSSKSAPDVRSVDQVVTSVEQVAEQVVKQPILVKSNSSYKTSMQTAKDLKASLTLIYGPQAQWRSVEQAMATATIYDTTKDVVVCLPTGEGKTTIITCCLLSPRENYPKKKTLFLVPTTSLLINLTNRLKSLVNVSVFGDGEENNSSLVLSTYQTATSDDMRDWISRQSAQGSLRRIVMDEAHTLITWGESFCLSFKDLQYLRPPSMQLVLMSATMPLSLIERIQDKFTLNHPQVFVKSCSKPKLYFSRMVYILVLSITYTC